MRRKPMWMLILMAALVLAGCAGTVPETGGTQNPALPVATEIRPDETGGATAPPPAAATAAGPGMPPIDATALPQRSTPAAAAPAVTITISPAATVPETCEPTREDMLGPFYTPGAPQRTAVGEGYVLSGVVRSAEDCRPVDGALVEFWMAGPNGEYSDDYRASQTVGVDGVYRLESNFPPPYSGRPSHIHLKVSAPGFDDLVTQHYPQQGQTEASFDLVIRPR